MRNGEMPSPFSDVVCAAFAPCESTTFSSLHGAGRTPVPIWFRGNAQDRATSRQ